MKVKQYIALSAMLIHSIAFCSDVATRLTSQGASLLAAYNALNTALGNNSLGPNTKNPLSDSNIKNSSPTPVHLTMFDESNNQINARPCLVNPNTVTYLSPNATSVKINTTTNTPLLTAITVESNTVYVLNNSNNTWSLTAQAAPQNYTYTNNTNVPLIITIAKNNIETQQQILPQGSVTQSIDPSAMIDVQVHANLSGIHTFYSSQASYTLTIVNNVLQLTPTSATGNSITNSTGLPMLLSVSGSSNQNNNTILQPGQSYQPTNPSNHLVIIPLVPDVSFNQQKASSLSISNTQGTLSISATANA